MLIDFGVVHSVNIKIALPVYIYKFAEVDTFAIKLFGKVITHERLLLLDVESWYVVFIVYAIQFIVTRCLVFKGAHAFI